MQNIPSIDVVILTYNRAEFFEKSLRSICDQTYQDFMVKVLNNGSTDNTEEVFNKVKAEYPHRKFDYLKLAENHLDQYLIDKKNDFITADYVIVFHDDDLMHPQYIEYAMKVIIKHPEIVLLLTELKGSHDPEQLAWEKATMKNKIGTTIELVRHYCLYNSSAYPSIIYKSVLYKATKWQKELYGNRGDMPFLIDIADHGKVCIMQCKWIHYRRHQGQNSFIFPHYSKFANLINKLREVLFKGTIKDRAIFYILITRWIMNTTINMHFVIENDWLPTKWIKNIDNIKFLKKRKRIYSTISKITLGDWKKITSHLRYFFKYLIAKARAPKYKIGLKLRSNDIDKYYNKIKELYSSNEFDYIELLVVPNTLDTLSKWKELINYNPNLMTYPKKENGDNYSIKFVIRNAPFELGFNLADASMVEQNRQIYEQTKEFADKLNAKYIIFHGGMNGNIKEVVRQLTSFNEARAILENMPFVALSNKSGEKFCLGSSVEEIKYVMENTGCGFCLDIGHAVCTADYQKITPYLYIKELNKLSPKIYYLSGMQHIKDLHMAHPHPEMEKLDTKRLEQEILPENALISIDMVKE